MDHNCAPNMVSYKLRILLRGFRWPVTSPHILKIFPLYAIFGLKQDLGLAFLPRPCFLSPGTFSVMVVLTNSKLPLVLPFFRVDNGRTIVWLEPFPNILALVSTIGTAKTSSVLIHKRLLVHLHKLPRLDFVPACAALFPRTHSFCLLGHFIFNNKIDQLAPV